MGKRLLSGLLFVLCFLTVPMVTQAEDKSVTDTYIGGGYAVTGQLSDVGYTAELYDATNGLPTSDSNYILGASDGYIWIGGYSGIIRYDGNTFERQDASGGLTSGRVIFEDSLKRLWIGTNDNGVVLLDNGKSTRFTYKDGLNSSSIRSFAEDGSGRIYIGSTDGVSYVDEDMLIHPVEYEALNNEMVVRIIADANGDIYGCTRSGAVFCINDGKVTDLYQSSDLKTEMITTIFTDPEKPGMLYYGTDSDCIYYGRFGDNADSFKKISIAPADNVYWITYVCERIWVTTEQNAGYLDENDVFHVLENIPMNNLIDMMTADYQGNLWFASSRQGVMKIVANNFNNLTKNAHLDEEVINSTCLHKGKLYIGTDSGLRIVDRKNRTIENEVTDYIGKARIRCIREDRSGNLWISTYTNGLGLVCLSSDDEIISYTEDDGMPSNEVRCTTTARDGSILVGSNGGLTVIKNGKIKRNAGTDDGIENPVFLTVEEGDGKEIYAGTDGDGIYVIEGEEIRRLGREEGLTSDVILRIKKDEKRGVYWIITSNSIEYMKDGAITVVDTFPYNNNFDIFFDDKENAWILSSYGVFSVKVSNMLENKVSDYRLYTIANGLPGAPTANAFSELDDDGTLYIAGRNGVSTVNINRFFSHDAQIAVGIGSITCNDTEILPDKKGKYTIPAVAGRIQISTAILDYTMTNPLIHVFLEGAGDPGITAVQSDLSALEYTGLSYGDYVLHIQVLDGGTRKVYQDETFNITKEPRLIELLVVRIILLILLALFAGFVVWRFMTGTIIRRQYEQIRLAKEEAERANSAKSRFLANMSHEIRTPINTIMGMDEMILREDYSRDSKAYYMSVVNYAIDIRNASESLLGLVNDLLDMSKIESGKMHLVKQEYDVNELLRSIVSMIRIRSTEKNLSFDVVVDEKLPVRLYGDAGKIKQVILNLLTNAVKYTEKGGFTLKVVVEDIKERDISLRFSVKDTGIGVKPEDMEKLFTAYERLDEEKNSGIQGTGLGLDISRRFAGLMDGKLWCESVYGEGSEFIFTLSQRIVDDTPIGEFSEHDENAVKGPYVPLFTAPDARVLVVDDNPMNLNVIRGLLKATKMSVTTASSGEECLALLESNSYNVVLLDHMMPGMDGPQTVAKIREDDTSLPVYALTANSTAGEDFYRSKGFNGYLGKPIDSKALEQAIMRHLPEEMIQKPGEDDAVEDLLSLPEEMSWINDVEGIDVDEGIKNSGGISSYIFSLNMFFDTIEDTARVIEDAYNAGDIRMYTVKVHALKSSARIIGAFELSGLAEKLEDAGNRNDTDYINDNTGSLMSIFRAFEEKLSGLKASPDESDDDRPPISEEELKDAYGALKEVVSQMDYDAVEMIAAQLKEFKLPEEDRKRLDSLEKRLKAFDWDGMEQLTEEMI